MSEEPRENPENKNSNQSEEQKNIKAERQKSGDDNVVFIGSKHLMNYVNSVALQFNTNKEVIIKARGKFISKAADISEVAKRQLEGVKTKDIAINTEQYESNGKNIKVSTIDIVLAK